MLNELGLVPTNRLAFYFASDESAYTVASELLIDGGMSEI
jgi:hypothetical protein